MTVVAKKPEGPRGAVMQFEIDRARWRATDGTTFNNSNGFTETSMQRVYAIAKTAVCDVIYRGGTFVIVVSPEKITMVQRPDAEEL